MASPPTGIVTFLFTDIEGSSKMWERNPQAMHRALARHDQILRDAVEERGGYVFKTVGDAFCCAFSTATDALEATLKAQRALFTESRNPNTQTRCLDLFDRVAQLGVYGVDRALEQYER